jgi:hypothetical protein
MLEDCMGRCNAMMAEALVQVNSLHVADHWVCDDNGLEDMAPMDVTMLDVVDMLDVCVLKVACRGNGGGELGRKGKMVSSLGMHMPC